MSDYIPREAAIAEIEEWHDMYPDSDAAREALSLAKRAIRKIPAADVRPVVRGRWVEEVVYYADDGNPCSAFFCNQCSTPFVVKYNFCPNCGADMMEESLCMTN